MICGLILAGGRSLRFGREKALAELDGRPLIAWVAEALDGHVDALAVSARAGSDAAAYASTRGWPVVADEDDHEGPLAGIAAGLRWAAARGADTLCTAPCDAPLLPAELVARLVAARASGAAAVARTAAGLEPLCALWPTSALETVETWTGRPAPRDVLVELKAAEVAFPDPAAFANLNTQADLAAAQCAAARRLR